MDEEEIRNKIKREYEEKLKKEVENMSFLFNTYEKDMSQSIMKIFEAKVQFPINPIPPGCVPIGTALF